MPKFLVETHTVSRIVVAATAKEAAQQTIRDEMRGSEARIGRTIRATRMAGHPVEFNVEDISDIEFEEAA